jgi:hypothetical protein
VAQLLELVDMHETVNGEAIIAAPSGTELAHGPGVGS